MSKEERTNKIRQLLGSPIRIVAKEGDTPEAEKDVPVATAAYSEDANGDGKKGAKSGDLGVLT